jgi:ribonuclease-3
MNQLVNYHACAAAGRLAGLRDALRLDASATKVGARDNDRVLGDACEALIAALYIDAGLPCARDFVMRFWAEAFANIDSPQSKDSKTLLQEWAMAQGLPVPKYRVVATEGSAHAPVFTMEVEVQGFPPETAQGGSKKDTEKLVAEQMLRKRMGAPK